MIRRDFIRSVGMLLGVPLLPIAPEQEIEELSEGTAVLKVKKNGVVFALGFRLENDEERDKQGLKFLSQAAYNTIHPYKFRPIEL